VSKRARRRRPGGHPAKPAWAIDATVEAIRRWHQAILDARSGPTVPASARALLKAASQAGVDLSDKAQLDAFIADRNNSSRTELAVGQRRQRPSLAGPARLTPH